MHIERSGYKLLLMVMMLPRKMMLLQVMMVVILTTSVATWQCGVRSVSRAGGGPSRGRSSRGGATWRGSRTMSPRRRRMTRTRVSHHHQ
jgi:hypothetical protein